MAGGKSNICFHFYIFFESEFGFLPKNSGLNPWRFQFWGTLAWVPSPSRPHPPKKTTDGSASPTHQLSKRSSTHGWSINVGAQGRAQQPTFVLILSMQRPESLLKFRGQEGGTMPRCTPISPPMVQNYRYQFTNFLPVGTHYLIIKQTFHSILKKT